ncbi:MAG: hypothetical protein ACREBU_01300, partial [Nitrososphaera sp.]
MNRRFAIIGIVIFAGMLYLTTYAHEAGHALMCQLAGFESKIIIQQYTFETRLTLCSERPADPYWYWAMGGIMGMLSATIPLVAFRKHVVVVIATTPHILANAITGTMETFVNEWYRTEAHTAALIASLTMLCV